MRPEKKDYAEYFYRYIKLVEGEDIIQVLKNQLQAFEKFYNSLSEEQGNFAYDEGKWTIKEVIGHVIDTERIMAYRALAFARGEEQALPGFEQDDYVSNGNFTKRKLENLINEYKTLRVSNIAMFKSFSEKEFNRKGTASGNQVSVIALAFIIAGHELHHLNILKETYL
jgi:hypothetical protein